MYELDILKNCTNFAKSRRCRAPFIGTGSFPLVLAEKVGSTSSFLSLDSPSRSSWVMAGGAFGDKW